ncbi:MAG: 5-formyltetrahydrofolate cyclo-ligase [Bacteroidales bacterium]|nr:5-formyltetrahydrofolate cyclo-ligase [Bacteroidales bacterium]
MKHYTFSDGESFDADASGLRQRLLECQTSLLNYDDVADHLEDPTFIARGNGFCATLYSEDFIESQHTKYAHRLSQLKEWIREECRSKPFLRSYVRAMKKEFTTQQLDAKSKIIMQKLEKHPSFVKANTVMLYSSLPDEVNTREWIPKWCTCKKVILPTVSGDDIIPVEVTADTHFTVGDFNIMEPVNTPYTGTFDLIIVPGMVFDPHGHRLGRGKGYYDRFLSQYPDVEKIGICFDFQQMDNIPAEPHDICMDLVIC